MLNVPEFSVSEFSRTIKNMVEDAFGYVRITGEISGLKRATSGHIYFSLKDDKAVLSAVCFRSAASMINFEIGDGLQVCASGRITTFEGRSNYQIIVEKLEVAGAGAILAMIEKRRQKLLAEGLFDDAHKKPLPFFPKIIGVITSPTGAVIEDIKHRIAARCPTQLLLYPTLVQGDKAAAEIISGIKFFNSLKNNRPEVLIIARGGGSFEDLLPFSDEALVREVFKSEIPIISAVGHESDTTLIDYVSDLRAPTPTAAAELATPVILDLKAQLKFLSERLEFLPRNYLQENFSHLQKLQRYIIDPATILTRIADKFSLLTRKLDLVLGNIFTEKKYKLGNLQLSPNFLLQKISHEKRALEFSAKQLDSRMETTIRQNQIALENLSKSLQSNNHREILKRGFALVKDEKGDLISSIFEAEKQKQITLEMFDGAKQLKILPND